MPQILRFMSWNVAMGAGSGTNPDAVADLINNENPDIVCLQQMRRPLVDYIVQRLYALGWHTRGTNNRTISYTYVLTIPSFEYGNAVMGRMPITYSDALFLPYDNVEQRAILRANANVPLLGTTWVYSVHIGLQAAYAVSQLGAALNWAKSGLASGSRRVIGGDFNYDDGSDQMKNTWLNAPGPPFPDTPYVSPFTVALSGDSIPGNAPTKWADYVFVSGPAVQITAAGVKTNKVSDHAAVLVNTTIS